MPRSYTTLHALDGFSITLTPTVPSGAAPSAVRPAHTLKSLYGCAYTTLPFKATVAETVRCEEAPAKTSDQHTLRASLQTHTSQLGTLNVTNAFHFTTGRQVRYEGTLHLEIEVPDRDCNLAYIYIDTVTEGERGGPSSRFRSPQLQDDWYTLKRYPGGLLAASSVPSEWPSLRVAKMYKDHLGDDGGAYLDGHPAVLTTFPSGGATGWSVRWAGDHTGPISLGSAVERFRSIRGGPPSCVDDLFEFVTDMTVRGPSVRFQEAFAVSMGTVPLLSARSGGPLGITLEEDLKSQATNPDLLDWSVPRPYPVTVVHELTLRTI